MSNTPRYDAKIKAILNALQPGERTCAITGERWEMNEREVDCYKRFQVPPGTLSPMGKRIRSSFFSTGYQFWWNKHFETGEPVLTFHHPASGVRVLPDAQWHTRDFSEINMEFTTDRPIFEMLAELQKRVPFLATYDIVEPENSITLVSLGDQNSFFVLGCRSKNSFFSTLLMDGEDSSVVMMGTNVQKSHSMGLCHTMYNCRYGFHSNDMMDSAFFNDCRNSKYIFCSTGLRNREYVFLNEQLTKTEYESKMAEIDLGKRSEVEKWMKRFDQMCNEEMMWPENFNYQTEDSTGEYLCRAVNCYEHFYAAPHAKDCTYVGYSFGNVDNCVFGWGASGGSSFQFETVNSARAQNLKYCMRCNDSRALEYCIQCINCEDCFACVGLNRKKFCILNKQYSEEEYWKKMDELKCAMLDRGEYGEFIPASLATAYPPEGGAIQYCAQTQEDLAKFGVRDFEPNRENAAGMDGADISAMKRAEDIPDSIDDLTDDWIGVPIYDPVAKRKFGFLKPEIEHYRKYRIAPPTKHYVPRMNEIVTSVNACVFENRTCVKTGKAIRVARNTRWPNRKMLCIEEYLKYINDRN